MLLKFFKQTLPQVIVALIVLAIAMWLKSLYSDQLYPFYFDTIKMPFYAIVTKWLQEYPLLSKGFAFLVMLYTAFYLLNINSKHIVIQQRTYLPAFFYIILVSCLITIQRINPALFSGLIIVFVFDHLFSIYHKENALDNLFRAGFFIGVSSLFYAPSILYFFALLLSIMSIRTFNLREWLVAFIGLITPWFFFILYHYLVNTDLQIAYRSLTTNLFTPVNQDNEGYLIYLFYAYCSILALITGFYLLNTLQTQKINVRKYYGVFFWFNLVSAVTIIFLPSISFEITYIAAIPFAFQFAHYFTTSKRKFWPGFLFLLLIIIAALMQFY